MALTRERLGTNAEDEFCRACHAATGGNPLFLRELLGALDSAGVVPSASAANEVQAVGPAAVAGSSCTGCDARPVAKRAGERSCGARRRQRVAARGRRVGHERGRRRATAADDLVRADIFADGARLGFIHPIVRAALYEDLAPGERQSRHAAAADALARAGASPSA